MDNACKRIGGVLNHPIQATLAVTVHRKVYGFLSPVAKATTEGLSKGGQPWLPKHQLLLNKSAFPNLKFIILYSIYKLKTRNQNILRFVSLQWQVDLNAQCGPP